MLLTEVYTANWYDKPECSNHGQMTGCLLLLVFRRVTQLLTHFTIDIASGMEYLSCRGFVHKVSMGFVS